MVQLLAPDDASPPRNLRSPRSRNTTFSSVTLAQSVARITLAAPAADLVGAALDGAVAAAAALVFAGVLGLSDQPPAGCAAPSRCSGAAPHPASTATPSAARRRGRVRMMVFLPSSHESVVL